MDNAVPSPVSEKPSPRISLLRPIVLGLLLIFVDAFYFNQGVFSIFVIIAVLLKILFAAVRGYFSNPSLSKQLICNYTIYIVAAVLVWGINIGQNALAFHKAKNVVAAIEAYHAKYEDYPQSLEVMVPEFLDHVPLAKYNLSFNSFYYRKTKENRPYFFYVIFPPYYRNFYNFEKHEWHKMD